MGLYCNSAWKKCGTASRREGDAGQDTLDQEESSQSLNEVMVSVAKLHGNTFGGLAV